jgi:hypothetical protein
VLVADKMQSLADKENAVDVDPAKLSLKERIRFFASKNKGTGACAGAVAGAGVAAGVAGASAVVAAASSGGVASATGAANATAPTVPPVSASGPMTTGSLPRGGTLINTDGASAESVIAAPAARVDVAPRNAAHPDSIAVSEAPPATTSRTRGLAAALENSLSAGGVAEAPALAGATRVIGASMGGRKVVKLKHGQAIGARLFAITSGGLARVEAVDSEGAAAAANVCVGDVLVKAPFDVREGLETSFALWRDKGDAWAVEFEPPR